jgi:hypothetical protein
MNIRIHDGPLLDDKLWRMNTHIHHGGGLCWMTNCAKQKIFFG